MAIHHAAPNYSRLEKARQIARTIVSNVLMRADSYDDNKILAEQLLDSLDRERTLQDKLKELTSQAEEEKPSQAQITVDTLSTFLAESVRALPQLPSAPSYYLEAGRIFDLDALAKSINYNLASRSKVVSDSESISKPKTRKTNGGDKTNTNPPNLASLDDLIAWVHGRRVTRRDNEIHNRLLELRLHYRSKPSGNVRVSEVTVEDVLNAVLASTPSNEAPVVNLRSVVEKGSLTILSGGKFCVNAVVERLNYLMLKRAEEADSTDE